VRDELLEYYERELTYLRQMGAEFCEKYPKVASRLMLEPTRCEDPHVERLIESFAFLAARIHLKIDDEFPEITEALLSVLYPHYVRPIPSATIVQFHLDPEQGKVSTGVTIPKGSMLYSQPVDGYACKFQCCYDTTLWPFRVLQAQWLTPDRLRPAVKSADAVAAVSLELECFPDVSFDKLELNSLRFYLNGESSLIHSLYELLCNNCAQILVRDRTPNSRKTPFYLPASHLQPAGFSDEESLLPYPRRSFSGYRLLQEYFHFPEKFFFVALNGLEQLRSAGFGPRVELIFLISGFERGERQQSLELGVSEKTIGLGCSPAINLFPHTAEPILLDHTRTEYLITPDVRRRRAMEIFSIDEVISPDPETHEVIKFEPFYRFRHTPAGHRERPKGFWHSRRQASTRRDDEGTEVYISFLDLSGRPLHPDSDSVTVHCTCSNRDLPHRLPMGNERGDFELEGMSSIKRVVALRKPTASVRPPTGKGMLWRLISHLSLNYLSIVEEGREALQEILRLYTFGESGYNERQVAGIQSVKSSRHFARVISENGVGFVRGHRVEMEFDEEQFVGGGVFLFASVLERFLGQYASLNSFSQLAARTQQRKEVLRQWPPRAGEAILL
jgi:type VI secretion system protein ImpG